VNGQGQVELVLQTGPFRVLWPPVSQKEFWGERHCSNRCRTNHETARHSNYVARNKAHVSHYALERRRRIWGTSNPRIAQVAEDLAFSTILPRLGFTDLYFVSRRRRLEPFDIIGSKDGERVLVDATTGVGKSGPAYRSAVSLCDALRMKRYVLFVKPDLNHYALKLSSGEHGLHCSAKDLVAIGNQI
jgi:hypothetical protein